MGYQKVRKGELKFTGLVISLFIIIGIFSGMYLYLLDSHANTGETLDESYNDTFRNITDKQARIEGNITLVQQSMNDIVEADDIFQAALNGFKGLGATLKLFGNFVGLTTDLTTSGFMLTNGIIPGWAQAIFIAAIIAVIVILVLAALKGEQKL